MFQISDYRSEVNDTFKGMVPTTDNVGGMEGLVQHFLSNEPTRLDFAMSARQLIGPHTFAARAAQVLADLDCFEQPIAKGA